MSAYHTLRICRMRHGCAPAAGMMAMLFLSLLACGCADGLVFTRPVSPPDSAKIIRQAPGETDRIVATARMELSAAKGHYPLRAALILQKPSFLRLEALPVIGTPDFFLSATPKEMRIWIPSQNEFYAGSPSAENMARFLPWALDLEDLVMILSGSCPRLDADGLTYRHSEEGGGLRVDMKTPSGTSQTIWMEKSGPLTRLVRYAPDGKEIYSVRYEGYASSLALPGKILLQWADREASLRVEYDDLKIEPSPDPSVFTLPVPDGVKILRLD